MPGRRQPHIRFTWERSGIGSCFRFLCRSSSIISVLGCRACSRFAQTTYQPFVIAARFCSMSKRPISWNNRYTSSLSSKFFSFDRWFRDLHSAKEVLIDSSSSSRQNCEPVTKPWSMCRVVSCHLARMSVANGHWRGGHGWQRPDANIIENPAGGTL
jgi:hypothetical protein